MTKAKILLIEDDRYVRENAAEILEYDGYTTQTAKDGVDGLALVEPFQPDIILCDIMMPRMDGYNVLMQLKENRETASLPFVFITAKVSRAEQRFGMNLGADDYLMKPFTPEELLQTVESRLGLKKIRDKATDDRLDDLRHNLMYTLPHELRTPLTGILGYTAMLLEDFEGFKRDQVLNMLQSVERAGLRLHRMIENYLLYAQLEVLQSDHERSLLLRQIVLNEPHEIIQHTTINHINSQNLYQPEVEFDLTPASVQIAPDDLTKIIKELVDNGMKFAFPNTPLKIHSHVESDLESESKHYQIRITNQGKGMTREQIKSVGAYMQFDRRIQEQQGAGLGLVIVKRLAQLYGGQMQIVSVPQQETSVIIQLPIASEA